jgi:hypothetical protein
VGGLRRLGLMDRYREKETGGYQTGIRRTEKRQLSYMLVLMHSFTLVEILCVGTLILLLN